MLRLERALATSNPPESGTLKQADLLFAYKSTYTEINNGILIRGFDPSLAPVQGPDAFAEPNIKIHSTYITNLSFYRRFRDPS